ncbi:HNH endonuclease [Methylobacterium terricola]|uniref:HNH endonuclease n=1 Tax=Methylobacterium terricola TaxID=2583531 RepID=UPI001486B839|nr:HNH endonuclease [Methylobacterium terricola]
MTVCNEMGEAKRRAAAPPKCRGCGSPITKENDSEAHIIPNALGGNLKPKGIICRECNTKLDAIADNALIEAFGDWPTLIDIPRDRGHNPPRIVNTRQGRRVRLEPDGSMSAIDVRYEVTEVEGGHSVEIAAGNWKTFRQLLKRASKDFPALDPIVAEQNARKVGIDDDDELKLGFDFSPEAIFGGLITAIWLFLIHRTGRSFMDWDQLLQVINSMQDHGGTFRYLVDGLPGLRGPEIPIGHKIIVRCVPESGELIAYVEILGILRVGGVFAGAGGPAKQIEHIYAYDVLERSDRSREFSIDLQKFNQQNWREVGLGPDDAERLRDHFRSALGAVFVRRYKERFSPSDVAAEGAASSPA